MRWYIWLFIKSLPVEVTSQPWLLFGAAMTIDCWLCPHTIPYTCTCISSYMYISLKIFWFREALKLLLLWSCYLQYTIDKIVTSFIKTFCFYHSFLFKTRCSSGKTVNIWNNQVCLTCYNLSYGKDNGTHELHYVATKPETNIINFLACSLFSHGGPIVGFFLTTQFQKKFLVFTVFLVWL